MEEKPKKLRKLSSKERAFCRQYIIDWNGTRAAKSAGYSEKSARSQASRLLTKAHIKAFIEEIQLDIAKNIGLSKTLIAQEWMKLAFSNASDVFSDWIEKKDFDGLSDDVKSCIAEIQTQTRKVEISEDVDVEIDFVKIKFHDKAKALEQLAKMFGYNAPDEVKGSLKLDVDSMPKIEFT